MNSNRNAMYAVVAAVGVALALWAGVPFYYLLVLACPVMMFFMMSSMSGGSGRRNDGASSDAGAQAVKTPSNDGSSK